MTLQLKLIAALGLVLLLIGSHWYAYDAGNENGSNAVLVKTQSAAIASKDAALALLQSTFEKHRRLAEEQASAAQQESERHALETAEIRRRAAADAGRRVPIDPARFCAGHATGSTQATPARGDGQASASTAFLPEPFVRDLRQLAADADEMTADLRTLKARSEGCFAGR